MSRIRVYTTEEIERGLLELACYHGSARAASRSLKGRGIKIHEATLRSWKKTYDEQYAQVCAEVLPKIRERMAAQQEVVAQRAAEVTLELVERTADTIKDLPVRDLAGAARNMEVVSATAIDKHSIIHDFPTEIVKHERAEDVMKRLADRFPGLVVEGTAEEITDAQPALDAA